jgi:hypothetical protein
MQYRAAPNIKRLISLCRTEIVYASVLLARSSGQEQVLLDLIENRELFIRLLSENFHTEMENIDREIESVLTH